MQQNFQGNERERERLNYSCGGPILLTPCDLIRTGIKQIIDYKEQQIQCLIMHIIQVLACIIT